MTLDRKQAAVKRSREYHSPLRAAQALDTRARVLEAARRQFTMHGYAASTIAIVAREADVSVHTIYGAFGSKIGLLKALMEVTVSGADDGVGILERSDPQAMRQETDQRRQLTMFAAGMAGQLERLRPVDDILRGAAAVDAEAAALREDIQQHQRRAAMRTVVAWVAARGPLREGLTQEDAAAIVWTLTSPEVHALLQSPWGWSRDRYSRWLADALISGLLPDQGPSHAS